MRHKRGLGREAAYIFVCLCFVLSTLAAAPVHAKASDPVAKGARLGGDDNRAEFVADLSREVPIEVFTLANPSRVIVDLPEVQFQFPRGEGRKGKGIVSAYRYGLFAKGKSRIVIDVKVPVLIDKAVVEPARDGRPARLVVGLVKTTDAKFDQAISARREKQAKTPEVQPASADASVAAEAEDSHDKRPLIMIDPGHGGVDSGAIGGGGTYEKDVVLNFAKILQKRIKDTKKFRVKLTRDIDIYIPLHDRVRLSRQAGADLFISIHADSIPRSKRRRRVRGASIYVLSERASDEEAQDLASMENRADIIAGVELPDSEDPVSNILIDLAQRETNGLSMFFSQLQIEEMKGVIPMHGDFTRSAGFRVLKAPDVPSVLIELGYISNATDEKNLTSDKWLDTTAATVQKAVEGYFSQHVERSPFWTR